MTSISTNGWLFTITIYASGQFEILKKNIARSGTDYITDSIDSKNSLIPAAQAYDTLKECVKKHYVLIAYIDKIENLITYALFVQVLATVLQICFSAIQFIIVSLIVLIMLINQINFLRFNDYLRDFKGRQQFDGSQYNDLVGIPSQVLRNCLRLSETNGVK